VLGLLPPSHREKTLNHDMILINKNIPRYRFFETDHPPESHGKALVYEEVDKVK
jgi:hypothetical protein